MPVDFSSLLADTLSNRGYEVEDASPIEGASGASYPVSMLARRDGERHLVDALSSRPVRDEDVQAVASIVDDTGLDGAIVLALQGDDTSSGPGADLVEVWGRPEVEQAVGALVVDGHLDGREVDDIGPSPVDPYAADDIEETTTEPAGRPEQPAAPSQAASGPNTSTGTTQRNGSNGSTPATSEPAQADPEPEPQPEPRTAQPADPDPGPERQPEAEPAQQADPQPEPEPEAEPTQTDDTGDGLDDDIDHGEFVDPEDMLERAEQLMQEGAVDDGDAELIVEDDDPEPEPEPSRQADARQAEPEPAQAEQTRSRPSQPDSDDGSDAEILAPEPETDQRPQPEGQPPEPEAAATARDTERTQPAAEERQPEPSPSATAASPAAAAGPASSETSFVSGATIEPQIDETEARMTAEEALFEADSARLELLPFQVYRYRAKLEGDGHTREEEGRVWVSTQSGAVVRAPDGDMIDDPEVPHERFQGSLSAHDTHEAAEEHLLETLERREELRQDYSESAVIERVMLEPDRDQLELTRLGKAYAPRWRIEGTNGTVFVDAVTGELVNE